MGVRSKKPERVRRQAMPVAMSIQWKPLRDSHYVIASLQRDGGGLRQIVAQQSTLRDVQAIARGNPDWTIIGLLLGQRFDCTVTLTPYVVIDSHVEVALPTLDEQAVTDAIRTLRNQIGRRDSTDVLGWYCSNGSADARVSSIHAAVHSASFEERWQTALILGNGANTGAFFLYDPSATRWFHAPFYELVDWEAGRRPPKPTCVAWPAYLTTASIVPLADPQPEPAPTPRPLATPPARQRTATIGGAIVTTRRTPTREAVIEAGRAAGRSALEIAKKLAGRAIALFRRVIEMITHARAQRAENAARQRAEAEATRVREEERRAREEQRRAKEAAERRAAREAAQRQAAELARQRAAEAEARRAAEAEERRKVEEEERRKAEAEAELRRAAETEARRKAAEEAERRRAAEADARRKAAEEAERRRAAEAEAKRQADEAEARRRAELAEIEARRRAEEAKAEAARKAAEAEADRRRREEEAEVRRVAEAEAKRKAEEESQRRAAEAEARRKAAEDARRKAEEEERRRAAEVEARRLAAEAEARRVAAEAEAKHQAAEAEARRVAAAAQAEAKRQASEAEARRVAEAEAEARRKDAEAEADRRRKAEEAEALRISVEVAAIRQRLARAPVDGPKRQAPNVHAAHPIDSEDTKASDGPYRYLALARREGFEVSEKIERGTPEHPETVWLLHEAEFGLRLFVVASDEEVREASLHYNLRAADDSVLQETAPEHRDLESRTIYGREACLNGLRARCRRLRATGALERDWKVSPT